MVHSWAFPSLFQEDSSSDRLHHSSNNNSSLSSIFNDMNKMMSIMHQRFQRLLGISSFSMDNIDDWMEDRKKLNDIEPNCTITTTESPMKISMQKGRRKKFRNIQTRTCIKELITDGKKQLYKEMNITDENGILISQSKSYQTIFINTNNDTIPTNINGDKNVITY